jgi:hypothetical protein
MNIIKVLFNINKKQKINNSQQELQDFSIYNFMKNILKLINNKLFKELHWHLYQLKDNLFRKLDLIQIFMDLSGFLQQLFSY